MRGINFIIVAALAASATAATAGTSDETISVSVVTHDLDLANAADAVRLGRRLDRAATDVCQEPGSRGVRAYAAFQSCRKRAREGARVDADRALAAARVGGGAVVSARR